MPSPASCIRCSRVAPLVTPSGLCQTCAATEGTAALTPRPEPPLSQPEPATASFPGPHEPSTAPAPNPTECSLPPAPLGYDLLARLGGGGMGDVYLAREQLADRTVAMKFLRAPGDPAALERFVIELRALAKLDHPNIVRVYASDFLRADPYFTMEFVPGGSLARADGLRSVPDAVRLVRAVAVAVAVAHGADVIHRDLKPSNILLGLDGAPKIADFGLAKRLDADDSPTASGVLGTPGYMPPEQVSRKNGEIGPWSDVYGLGATLYHTLVGRAPFVGDSVADTITKVLADPPERVRALRPEVPLALEAVVMKCLEKDPGDRYQSVPELLDDLDRYETGQKPVAPLLTNRRRLARWTKRNRTAVLAACGAAVVVVAAFILGAAYRPKRAPTPDELVAEAQSRLRRGQSVTLVGAAGEPAFHRWHLSPSAIGKSPQNDGAPAFQSGTATLLELLPDPGVDRYRVTAELCHLLGDRVPNVAISPSTVGMYVGHDTQTADAGWRVNTLFLVRFTDKAPQPLPNAPKRTVAQFGDALYVQHPDGRLPTLSWSGTASTEFQTKRSGEWPGKWRKVRFDVTPDGFRAEWWDEATGAFVVATELTGAQAAARFTAVRTRVEKYAPGTGIVPIWNPRAPLGVFCDRSTVSFRNVVVEPIP